MKTEAVLPYEDVRAILLEANSFHIQDCICRAQQDQLGSRKCDFPVNMCLGFSSEEGAAGPGFISREEALAILEKSEEVGLVHTVSNVMQGVGLRLQLLWLLLRHPAQHQRMGDRELGGVCQLFCRDRSRNLRGLR